MVYAQYKIKRYGNFQTLTLTKLQKQSFLPDTEVFHVPKEIRAR
jgi:hypothetical protein